MILAVITLEISYMEEIEKMLEAETDIDEWIEAKETSESQLIMENEAEDVNTEVKENNQFDSKESKSESSVLHKDDDVLEELHFDDSFRKSDDKDETTVASTWEEDEIHPLHFEDPPLHLK